MKCPKCGREANWLGVCAFCIQEEIRRQPVHWDGNTLTIGDTNQNRDRNKSPDNKNSTEIRK